MTSYLFFFRAPSVKILYIPCPKNASTSALIWLAELEAAAHDVVFTARLRNRRSATHFLITERVLLPDLPWYLKRNADHFLFGITRNPYTRIASAYSDKVNRLVKKTMPKLYIKSLLATMAAGPINWFDNKYAIAYMQKSLSFNAFLRALCVAGLDIDSHYQPQSLLMRPDLLFRAQFFDQVDFAESLLREIAVHFAKLEMKLNHTQKLSLPKGIPIVPRWNTSGTAKSNNSYDSMYTPALRSIVNDLYIDDFADFGYEMLT